MSDRQDVVETQVAASGVDEHLFRGRRVFAELAGSTSYASLLSLAISGRELSPKDSALFDELTTICTVADARIWPMKACRLVASYGGLLEGLAAGIVALGSPLIGPWVSYPAAGALLVAFAERTAGAGEAERAAHAAELVQRHDRLPGFGTPFRHTDERIEALTRAVERHGASGRRYWQLWLALVAAARELRRVEANVASAGAAVALDLGFPLEDLEAVGLCNALHMFVAHAREGSRQRHRLLQELPSAVVRYVGPARRRSGD